MVTWTAVFSALGAPGLGMALDNLRRTTEEPPKQVRTDSYGKDRFGRYRFKGDGLGEP